MRKASEDVAWLEWVCAVLSLLLGVLVVVGAVAVAARWWTL